VAPHRPRSHQFADKAIVRLHDAFISAGWTVEDLDKDYGEDLLVRIFKNEQATSYTFYVQAKSTSNIRRYIRKNDTFISYPFNTQHLQHWNDFWEPVVLAIWDSQADVTYWETAQTPERLPDIARKRPIFFIPLSNVLDDEGMKRIAARTVRRHRRFEREQQGAQILIDRLQELLGIEIEYEPQAGLLSVATPDGRTELTVFGKLQERTQDLADSERISIEEMIHRVLNKGLEEVEMLRQAGRLNDLEDYTRAIELRNELDETP
jgi:hypothetical protein